MPSLRLVSLFATWVLAGCAGPPVPDDAALDAGADASRLLDADPTSDAWRAPDAWVDPRDAFMADGSVPGPARDATRPVAPLSGSRVSTRRPTLRWALASGADGARIELCADAACTTLVTSLDVAAPATSASPALDLPAGIVFWRVVPTTGGTPGTASATWRLVVPHVSAPNDLAWGHAADFDGDGFSDLLLGGGPLGCSSCGAFRIVYGAPAGLRSLATDVPDTGRVYDAAVEPAPSSWAVTDVNGDGVSDLIALADVGDTTQPRVADLFFGEPTTGLRPDRATTLARPSDAATQCYLQGVSALGDLDGDGYGDVVLTARTLADAGSHPVRTRMFVSFGGPDGLGPPVEAPLAPTSELDVALPHGVGDVTGDGRPDVVVAGYDALTLYAGTVGSLVAVDGWRIAFPAGSVPFAPMVAAPADLDGDGRPDVIAVSTSMGLVLASSGSGLATSALASWTPLTTGVPVGASPGDVDADGIDDLVTDSLFVLTTKEPVESFTLHPGGASGPTPGGDAFWLPHGSMPERGGPFARVTLPGDVDGDGLADVVLEGNDGLFVARGRASAPRIVVGAIPDGPS